VLPVVNVVVPFNTRAFWRVEVDWSEYSETVLLVETASYGVDARIGLQNVRHSRFKMLEDGSISEGSF